ncbi:unnamed protein product [Cylicostephanus goldi]|uniref:Serine-threonine/tyrosine-protein kinase catalytic domain-containing protein n=1 Tax=Cylicostephanus goldi TaxID=71465 RepID=A0A3P6TBS0_CYLGO|nr:unnamed protein product [Cylicostephanus goldi]
MQIQINFTQLHSLGIMCWEIYNNGIEPYPGMTVAEVNQNVKEGYRMELPSFIPPEVQNLIRVRCWSDNPNERYSMPDIAKHLQRILQIPRPDFAAIRAARMAAEATQPTIEAGGASQRPQSSAVGGPRRRSMIGQRQTRPPVGVRRGRSRCTLESIC